MHLGVKDQEKTLMMPRNYHIQVIIQVDACTTSELIKQCIGTKSAKMLTKTTLIGNTRKIFTMLLMELDLTIRSTTMALELLELICPLIRAQT
jgi:hypothetical protein